MNKLKVEIQKTQKPKEKFEIVFSENTPPDIVAKTIKMLSTNHYVIGVQIQKVKKSKLLLEEKE